MGNGVSASGGESGEHAAAPYASVEEARADGRTQEEIDAYFAAKEAVEAAPVAVPEPEVLAVRLMFKQVDTDGDDKVSLAELRELFSALGYLEDEVGPLSQQYMEKFDLVGNRELDMESFIKLYGSLKASEGHRIEKYHRDVDEAEKEAARRLANRVARAKDPEFDEKQEAEQKAKAHEKTLQRAATKKAEKTTTGGDDAAPPGKADAEPATAAASSTAAPAPADAAAAEAAGEAAGAVAAPAPAE